MEYAGSRQARATEVTLCLKADVSKAADLSQLLLATQTETCLILARLTSTCKVSSDKMAEIMSMQNPGKRKKGAGNMLQSG